jgi:hypothetical protein
MAVTESSLLSLSQSGLVGCGGHPIRCRTVNRLRGPVSPSTSTSEDIPSRSFRNTFNSSHCLIKIQRDTHSQSKVSRGEALGQSRQAVPLTVFSSAPDTRWTAFSRVGELRGWSPIYSRSDLSTGNKREIISMAMACRGLRISHASQMRCGLTVKDSNYLYTRWLKRPMY